MRYCKRCILPDTRPNLTLNENGICCACEASDTRPAIDWEQRGDLFRSVVEHAKSRSHGYDCLIPVSGGKDSTWQVIKCLEYGLNPLAVTWKCPSRTDVGSRNLENLVNIGVDHIDYQINPKVERKFLLHTLKKFGSTAIPMHMAIFNIPMMIAVRFNIPLVVWGENSAFEYGGRSEERTGFRLDRAWVMKYGVTHGTTANDWVSPDITRKELTPYFGASEDELEKAEVLAVFLGYYFSWDPEETRRVAVEHGFSADPAGPKTGYYDFADIDDDFISIHHWLKWYKFGFTRLFDNLSLEIRNGRMTRERAVEIVNEYGVEPPYADIDKFCIFTGISREKFFSICENFRNQEIWSRQGDVWKIKDFLLPDWNWR